MAGPGRVLLAESNRDDAQLVKEAFRAGHIPNQVEVAEAEEQVMAQLKRGNGTLPALVILAMPLPMVENFRLLRWIRAQPELQGLAVFVLSGLRIPDEEARAHALGSDCYGEKPLEFPDWIKLVKRLEERWLRPTVKSPCLGGG